MSKILAVRTSKVNASKRIQNAARAFTANGLPGQTALNFKSGKPAGGPGSAWHAYFARKIVGRETNIHLTNPADNARDTLPSPTFWGQFFGNSFYRTWYY